MWVLGRASMDKPTGWYPKVREVGDIVHKARMMGSKSQQAGCSTGIPRIVGTLLQRSLSTGMAWDF